MGDWARQREQIANYDAMLAEQENARIQQMRDNAQRNLEHEVANNLGHVAMRGAVEKG